MIKITPLIKHLNNRPLFSLVFLLSILSLSYYLSFALRYEFRISGNSFDLFLHTLPVLLVIRLTFAHYFGLYRGWLGHAGISDLVDVLKYDSLSSLAFTLFLVLFGYIPGFSRAIVLLDWVLNLVCVGGARFARRLVKETVNHLLNNQNTETKTHVLIVGAGDGGLMILREINNNPRLKYHPVGFIDDNQRKIGNKIEGIPVLGNHKQIPEIVEQSCIDEIIIAIPSATSQQLKEIVNNCRKSGVKVKTTPSVNNLINGTVHLNQVREIQIEDLLGRKPIDLDHSRVREEIKLKSILVTGAGGSIGSELAFQISRYRFKELILFDRGETELYHTELKLKKLGLEGSVIPVIGDILDRDRLEEIMERHRPELVYHAAAYKHVPMMEINPIEAVKNNLFGSLNVAEAAVKYGVQKFIFVSSDKAVRPTSVMGATKRAVELALKNMKNTKFIAVRFGNVLDSRGSVVPLFKRQIAQGGPVTVTHPYIIRYFMSIPEACQLILQSGAIGKGGELFLLDMGEPVKIVDLAENLIRLAGFEPYKDIDIVFTGLRPGEKLYEELFNPWEQLLPTTHKKIMRVDTGEVDSRIIETYLAELEGHVKNQDRNRVISCLKKIVPSFKESYQFQADCLDRAVIGNSELNIRFMGREFKGEITEIEKGRSMQIALPSFFETDLENLGGNLEATFYYASEKKVIRFYTSVISGKNGSGPASLKVVYPKYFEERDNMRSPSRLIIH